MFKEAFPGFVTGKLSDLAGLFVFPLLILTLFLPAIDRSGRRTLAALPFALTGLVFAGLKVDVAFSRSLVETVHLITGLSLGIVADPTDLIALGSVAAAWMYWRRELTRPVARTQELKRLSRARLAAVLVIGALATVATSRFPPTEVIALSAHPSVPGDLYALVSPESPSREDENGSLYRTTDGGLTWTRIGPGGSAMVSDPEPTRRGAIYVLRDQQLYHFVDGRPDRLGPPAELLRPAATFITTTTRLSASQAGVVYVWLGRDALRFDRLTAQWSRMDLPGEVNAIAGGSQADLAIAGGRVWRTENAGKAWQEVGTFPLNDPDLAIDPGNDAHVLAGVANGLLRSLDGGRNWRQVWGSEQPYAQLPSRWTIVFDPRYANRIYASAAGGRTPLLVSADGGATWRTSELAARAVAITADPEHAVFISAGERGVYRQGSDWPTLEPWQKRASGLPTR